MKDKPTCKICNGPVPLNSLGKPRKTCSDECKAKRNSEASSNRTKKHPWGGG